MILLVIFISAFDETPDHMTVVFGQDLFLPCSARNLTADSKDGLRILWKLNELDIQSKASVFSNGTLLVPLINSDDLGNYTCSVYDSADNMVLTSPPATVFHACNCLLLPVHKFLFWLFSLQLPQFSLYSPLYKICFSCFLCNIWKRTKKYKCLSIFDSVGKIRLKKEPVCRK